MFLEVVSSFAVQECYEHVKKMFDSLKEFNKLGCDILLLTQRPTTGGGGFLKLIGMPFRILLNESESMKQILMHRQSALSMAGIRALHIYTEFLCNDQPLEITSSSNKNGKVEEGEFCYSIQKQQSGCILLNREGQILYSYLCTDSSDWPDVEILLEQVKLNQIRRPSTAKSSQQQSSQLTISTEILVSDCLENNQNNNQINTNNLIENSEIAVNKRKCCIIN
ncbi:hypothetical protein ACQ4LE_001170 [Meloidogyne hapla]